MIFFDDDNDFDNDQEFDYDKIRDMEYDPERGRYVGKDGSEFRVVPFANGRGYKYDYYDKTTYENNPHNSIHIKADLNENWTRVDNDRDNNKQEKSSGKGCYLTTACMIHSQKNFNDNCYELMILRWFRDNFVSKEDIAHYYVVAPMIVEQINATYDNGKIYNWIYDNVISKCVEAIQKGDYEFAYNRYKNSVLVLEKQFLNQKLNLNSAKVLKFNNNI